MREEGGDPQRIKEELIAANKRLADYTDALLKNVKGALMKGAEGANKVGRRMPAYQFWTCTSRSLRLGHDVLH